MQLLFCPSFSKALDKLRSVTKDDIQELLGKHPHTPDIKSIDHFGDYEVLKCYLLNKRVRMMVFFTIAKGKYVPFAVIKKESKKGRNIMKDNYIDLFSGDIRRVLQDVKTGNYEIKEL